MRLIAQTEYTYDCLAEEERVGACLLRLFNRNNLQYQLRDRLNSIQEVDHSDTRRLSPSRKDYTPQL